MRLTMDNTLELVIEKLIRVSTNEEIYNKYISNKLEENLKNLGFTEHDIMMLILEINQLFVSTDYIVPYIENIESVSDIKDIIFKTLSTKRIVS